MERSEELGTENETLDAVAVLMTGRRNGDLAASLAAHLFKSENPGSQTRKFAGYFAWFNRRVQQNKPICL